MAANSPNWGSWVTHFDSVGQAPTMNLSFNEPSNTIVSIFFDKMVISLQGSDQYKMAASIGLAGHFPLALPDEFPLAGYLLIVRGVVLKSSASSAILTASIGEKVFAEEWPTTGGVVDVDADKGEPQEDIAEFSFEISCFSGDQHLAMGQPPVFPPVPPLTLSIGMYARRRSVDASIEMHLEALDIAMLRGQ